MIRFIFIFLSFFSALFVAPVSFAQSTPSAATASLDVSRARLAALEARLKNGSAPADPQNLALLKFKIEQANLLFQNMESNEAPFLLQSPYDETKTLIAATLTRAESIARAKGDAVYPSTSQMHERAYIAQADGSAQPYWIFVPRDYTPRKQWPLVVFLHGYNPEISKIQPWIPGPEMWQPATERGFIMAVPYGRRNSDFVNIGEDDTLAVTDFVSARYNVDAERTFLLGPSMGGFGVHAVGLHNPERFAAIAPVCAQTDLYLWHKLEREELPAWKRVLHDTNDPRHLKLNAFQLPIFMQHGDADYVVDVEHSRSFYRDLKALDFPAFYREIRGGSHFIYFDDSTFQIALDWMKKIRRLPPPSRVRFSTGSLRNDKSYWVQITGFRDYSAMAHLDAQIKADNIIEVKTANVARFVLKPPAEFLKADAPVTLIVDGVEVEQKFDAAKAIFWPPAIPKAIVMQKTPRRVGPIKECYRDAFMIVYGDKKDEVNARRFLKEWEEFADGRPPIKADKDVNADDKKNYNLVLFGTRGTNSLLAPISDKLPLELTPKGYRVGQREYSLNGKQVGLQFCYPSPFDAARMIVVQSGIYWGGALPVNHKFDLLPEYIVYENETEFSDQTNRALVAGFFDDDWNLPTAKTVQAKATQ